MLERYRFLWTLGFLLIVPHCANAQAIANFHTLNTLDNSTTDYDFNEVYGSISFQLGQPFWIKSNGARAPYHNVDLAVVMALQDLAGNLNSLFAHKTGSYVLTLSVVNANTGKEVAKAPLISVSSDVQSVLGFQKSRDDLFSLTQLQTMRDYIPIDQDSNKFRITVEASQVESSVLDLGILRKLVSFEGQIAGLANLPVSTAADALLGSFEGILKGIFDSNKKEVGNNSSEMAFIKRDAPGHANAAEVVIETHPKDVGGKVLDVFLPITLNFNVEPTRLAARVGPTGVFDFIPTSIIDQTSLIGGTSAEDGTLFDALRSAKDPKVRGFLDELIDKQKIVGKSAAIGCRDFYNSLAHYLTQRDQAAFYYAFVRLYEPELKTSQDGEGCLQEPMRGELNKWLKLPPGGLEIVSSSQPAAHVVAVGRNGDVINPISIITDAEQPADKAAGIMTSLAELAFSSHEALQPQPVTPGATPSIEPGTIPLIAVRPEAPPER